MRILFTGASSVVGSRVLKRILKSVDDVEIWCVRHKNEVAIPDSRIRVVDLDLAQTVERASLPDAFDLVIHFAGVTHAHDPEVYRAVNVHGTMRLTELARARGCRRFVYISTRCATPGSGAYGESKLAAENELRKLSWENLLIIRPSEVYGGGGKEGIDKLIALARRWHLTPLLFGNSKISFAPLHLEDFATIVADEIVKRESSLTILELCGPEDLNGPALARRIAKRYSALPIPVWWPLFELMVKIGASPGFNVAVPDQLQRLECAKTSSAAQADRTGRIRFLID
jgi:nucleoside-diphosphate-sugar epimerase